VALNDSVVQSLLMRGLPVNRENYLDMAGLKEPLPVELEAELPPELQKDYVAEGSPGQELRGIKRRRRRR
jgi:hypothetical protein